MNNRVEKYCDWKGGLAESLDFGTTNAQNIMIKLLICDGDKKRSQRQYIFDPGFLYFGAGFYQHIKYKKCTVISYAGFIQSKDADLSEKELIQNYLNIHRYFVNKNKEEFQKIIENKKKEDNDKEEKEEEKEEKEKEKKENEEIINDKDKKENKKEEKINEKINENEKEEKIKEKNDNDEDKKDNKKDEINTSNNNLIIIEENDNDNDNDNDNGNNNGNDNEQEKEDTNKIGEINKKIVERYGIQIRETIYKIKEGNYHIIEEEVKKQNFNFLNLFN